MKLKLTQTVHSYDGKELPGQDGPLTLRNVCEIALNSQQQGEVLTPEHKQMVYDLSLRLYNKDDTIDLKLEEAAFIKQQAGKHLTPLIYGRLCDALEQHGKEE